MPDPDVLTLHELAALLRGWNETPYTLAQSAEVPGFEVGGQRRFRRNDVASWFDRQSSKAAEARDGDR